MTTQTSSAKLTFREKLGYGIATAGDGAVYNFVGIYFLFFLTTVAGINPGKAGTISSVALFASAFFTIFIGFFSDNSKCKTGRRRPYIKAGLPFLFISFVAMFTNVSIDGNIKVLYYGLLAIIFWLSYAMFYVPYTALGAEITDDYDDRTRIRTYAVTCNSIGNYFGMVFPLLIVAFFTGIGTSDSIAWTFTATVSGIFSVLTISFMLKQTKGKEIIIPAEDRQKQKNIFKDYIDVIKVKPCKYLLISIIFAIIGYTIFNGSVAYFITYNLGLPESYTSTIFLVMCIVAIIYAPIVNKLAIKKGKRSAYIIAMLGSAALMIVLKLIGVESQTMLLVLAAVYGIGGAGYWQLMSAVIYDLTEIVELKYGKRNEGTLSSLQSVFQQIGTSLGMLITGWLLNLSGFDGALSVQSQGTLSAIEMLLTVLPAVGFILGAVMMYLFPVTKGKYELVQTALKDKKRTGEFCKDGLGRII